MRKDSQSSDSQARHNENIAIDIWRTNITSGCDIEDEMNKLFLRKELANFLKNLAILAELCVP